MSIDTSKLSQVLEELQVQYGKVFILTIREPGQSGLDIRAHTYSVTMIEKYASINGTYASTEEVSHAINQVLREEWTIINDVKLLATKNVCCIKCPNCGFTGAIYGGKEFHNELWVIKSSNRTLQPDNHCIKCYHPLPSFFEVHIKEDTTTIIYNGKEIGKIEWIIN